MYGCLFAILFFLFFLVLFFISSILNVVGGLWRSTQRLNDKAKQRQYDAPGTEQDSRSGRQNSQSGSWNTRGGGFAEREQSRHRGTNTNARANGGKIYQSGEGEYVDFEDIKE